MNFILTEDNFVTCQICGKELEKIDGRHLNRCSGISLDDYILKYQTPTITKKKYEKELVNIEKRKTSKSDCEGKTKIVKCYFCKNDFEVNINQSNEYSVCKECKEKGLISPSVKKASDNLKKSMIEKYGVDNPSLLESVNEKRSKKYNNKSEEEKREIVEKQKEGMILRFGEDYKKDIQKLREEGMLKKHGVRHALQIKESIEKFKETISNKDYTEMVLKVKSTKKEKYGDENYINVEKIKETNNKRYGVEWPRQSKEIMSKALETRNKNMFEKVKVFLKNQHLELQDEIYKDAFYSYTFKCLKCNHVFKQNWNAIQQNFTCPNCRPEIQIGSSSAEKEIQEIIKSFNFQNISFNNRNLIYPLELDIVIHDIKIAIEYCGLRWHSWKMLLNTRKNIKDVRKYHFLKKENCNKLGYKLIQIFEDEWIYHKEIVLNRLKQILQVRSSLKIYPRNCKVKPIDSNIKNEFLEKFHLQGKDISSINIGAFYNDKLVSVMTFSKPNISKGNKINDNKKIYELNRFCSDYEYHIPGIAGKLLSYFKKNFEWDEIFSYCDLRWSDGNLYYKLGFSLIGHTGINYWYWNPNKSVKRIHRFNLRKRDDEPEDISEMTLRQLEGYEIIWDCGNLKFLMSKNN